MKKYLSYSELWLYTHDKDRYIKQYIEGYSEPPNDKMVLGTLIGQAIQDPAFPLVERMKAEEFSGKAILNAKKIAEYIPQPDEAEASYRGVLEGIALFGMLDGILDGCLEEYKTTDQQDSWTQHRVDTDDQLSFYALLRYLTYHDYWPRITLYRGNTETGRVKVFRTARGYRDIEYIKDKILRVVGEIKNEGLWNLRLSRKEIEQRNQQDLGLRVPGWQRSLSNQ